MFLEMLILITVLMGLVKTDKREPKESPEERREKDKAFRKERRERAERNRGPMVDENGNMTVPKGHKGKKYAYYAVARFHVKRFTRTNFEKAKAKLTRQGLTLERYRMQIRAKEHPVQATICVAIVFGIYCYIMFNLFGSYGVLAGVAPIAVGAAVQPNELLNTGMVSAEDFAEVSGNHTDVEIQAALDYAKANYKPIVYVGPGTWTITSSIRLTPRGATTHWNDISIIGASSELTLFDVSGITDGIALSFEVYDQGGGSEDIGIHVNYVKLADFRMDGDVLTQDAIKFNYSYHIRVDNIEIHDFTHAAGHDINFNRATFIIVIDTELWYGYSGIYSEGTLTLKMIGGTVALCTRGALIYFSKRVTFIGTVVEQNDYGVTLGSHTYSVGLYDLYIEGNQEQDFNIGSATEVQADQPHHVVIDNCNSWDDSVPSQAHIFISITRGDNITVQNCTSFGHDEYFAVVGQATGFLSNDNTFINNWFGDIFDRTSDTAFLNNLETARRTTIQMLDIPFDYIDDARGDTIYMETNPISHNFSLEYEFVNPADISNFTLTNSGAGGEVDYTTDDPSESGTVSSETGNVAWQWAQAIGVAAFRIGNYAKFECKMKANDASETDINIGLRNAADKYAKFNINAGRIHAQSKNGGAHTTDTGIDISDDAFVTLNIWGVPDYYGTGVQKVYFYVDDVLVHTATDETANDLLYVWIFSRTTSNTNLIHTVDYIKVWQMRT